MPYDNDFEPLEMELTDDDFEFHFDVYDSPYDFDGYDVEGDYPEDHDLDYCDYSEDLWNER